MKKENIIFMLVIASLILGCGAPATPTSLPVPSVTPAARPTVTATAIPTVTKEPATPTLTSEPSLKTDGPYFAYFRKVNGVYELAIMDADGKGRKIIQFPHEMVNLPALKLVSPDGKWMAFHTGSAGNYGEMPGQGTSDLTLNLLNLVTGEEQVVTPLLSKDYPDNFIEATRKLNDPDITPQSLHDAFINGITEAVAWSPDGRYLAFAGQMDGLSSDLYVYDVNEKTIRRLSSGDQELQWIEWSPDGNWILHSGVFGVGAGMTFDIYAATVDGSSAPYISTSILHDGIENWLNDHQYFENDGENVLGLYGLRLVDVDTGRITKIWDETFYSYAVDTSGMWVAILDSPDASWGENGLEVEIDFVPGIYLINLTTLEQSRVEALDNHTFDDITSSGLEGQEFAITERASPSLKANTVFLSTDGTLTQTDLGDDAKIAVSPNQKFWIAVTDPEVKIFLADNTLVNSVPFQKTIYDDIAWRPDSSGLFLISGTHIFSMNVPAGDIQVVETDVTYDDYNPTYGWIGGR